MIIIIGDILQGFASEKIPGGKLLKVRVNYNDVITNVKIMGDFFMHPENAIEVIEAVLINTKKDESELAIQQKIEKTIEAINVKLIGVTPEAIARVLKQAMK